MNCRDNAARILVVLGAVVLISIAGPGVPLLFASGPFRGLDAPSALCTSYCAPAFFVKTLSSRSTHHAGEPNEIVPVPANRYGNSL
jgi:hypothetical protein